MQEILINSENFSFSAAITKNRRVLGLQKRSISFRTHEKHPREVISIRFSEIINGEKKIIILKRGKMEILTRLFLLGRADPFIQSGCSACDKHDREITEANWRENEGKPPEQWKTVMNADQMRLALIEMPEIVSFKLQEYEKQIFYLKCVVSKKIPVEIMRYLYHSDFSTFNIYHEEFWEDLIFGVSENTLQDLISFQKMT